MATGIILGLWPLLPDFLTVGWLDALDIALVALLLFQLYRIVKGSVAINIITGIMSVYFLWLIVRALKMQLLATILGQFIGVGVIAIIVVFQQELRRFLLLIGTNGFLGKRKWKDSWRNLTTPDGGQHSLDIHNIVKACRNMAETKTGALLVIQTKTDLGFFANTGEAVGAKLSARLLESVFFKNSPLHDGAVIISGDHLDAARCVLPVSEKENFPAHLGMRHRAAAGITETTDAIAIVVSEQTGEICFAQNGNLRMAITPDELRKLLEREFPA